MTVLFLAFKKGHFVITWPVYIRNTKYKYNSIIMNYHKQTKDMRLCK